MQTNEMFAFWKGGATEQVRDGFLNKKAVANQCSPRRRGDPPEIYPCGHKLRISAVYEKNPLRPLGEPDFLCDRYTIDEHITVADFCNLFFRLVFTRDLIGRFN